MFREIGKKQLQKIRKYFQKWGEEQLQGSKNGYRNGTQVEKRGKG